jgi:hypothetical protein
MGKNWPLTSRCIRISKGILRVTGLPMTDEERITPKPTKPPTNLSIQLSIHAFIYPSTFLHTKITSHRARTHTYICILPAFFTFSPLRLVSTSLTFPYNFAPSHHHHHTHQGSWML